MKYQNIGCISSSSNKSNYAFKKILEHYQLADIRQIDDLTDIDLIIVLGGDGFMLHTLHRYMHLNIPFFGMNSGTVGFLMNRYDEQNLIKRLESAHETKVKPLKMTVTDVHGNVKDALAINEVYLYRKSTQACKIKVTVDNKTRMKVLISDGIMVSTPAGSTAYNSSVGGPIIPINADLLALTAISPFRPRRWHGALLPHDSVVEFEILNATKRPANAVADYIEIRNAQHVKICQEPNTEIRLLFDDNHNLEERIIKEQFSY
jgi:NAD+ kinase